MAEAVSSSHGFGRFDGRMINPDAVLGTCAVASVAAVPVLHTPAAMLFLLAGVLGFAIRPMRSVVHLYESRALLILPIFCILSMLWSLHPALSLRFGIQLSATFVIAILIAKRVSLRSVMLTVFSVLFLLVLLSIAQGPYRSDTGALVGVFGSKNEMAGMSALLSLISFGLAVMPDRPRLGRLLAAAGAIVGVSAIILAQSVGALGYLPVGIGALVSILMMRRLRLSARVMGGAFLILAVAWAGLTIIANAEATAAMFFDLTGKDVMLTGRVELWQVAINLIAERPLLGIGYQAFWVQGHPPAEVLWAIFGIESRSGFNFHNTYLSNAVEIGLIGVAIQVAMIGAAVVLSGRLALRTGSRDAALLFAMSAMMAVTTLLEAPIYFQFNLHTVLMVATVVYAADGLKSLRAPA